MVFRKVNSNLVLAHDGSRVARVRTVNLGWSNQNNSSCATCERLGVVRVLIVIVGTSSGALSELYEFFLARVGKHLLVDLQK
jgi:hypothetical protein